MVQRRGVECWYWEQSDPSAGLGDGAGDVGLCLSALHPKVLCELLDFEKVFGVNCGAGGGQRAQHVRLQSRDTDTHTHSSLLLFHYCYTAYLNTVYHCEVLSIQQKLSLCRKTVQHILYPFSAHSLIISASPLQLCLQTAQ